MNVIYILRSISYPVSLQYFAITLFSIWSLSVLFCSSFFNIKCFIVNFNVLHSKYCTIFPVDTGRKLDVHNTFRRRPERLMYVQFTSCVYGVVMNISSSFVTLFSFDHRQCCLTSVFFTFHCFLLNIFVFSGNILFWI